MGSKSNQHIRFNLSLALKFRVYCAFTFIRICNYFIFSRIGEHNEKRFVQSDFTTKNELQSCNPDIEQNEYAFRVIVSCSQLNYSLAALLR